jgi:hypothetical protein
MEIKMYSELLKNILICIWISSSDNEFIFSFGLTLIFIYIQLKYDNLDLNLIIFYTFYNLLNSLHEDIIFNIIFYNTIADTLFLITNNFLKKEFSLIFTLIFCQYLLNYSYLYLFSFLIGTIFNKYSIYLTPLFLFFVIEKIENLYFGYRYF